MKRRLLSALLALSMIFSIIPTAFASNPATGKAGGLGSYKTFTTFGTGGETYVQNGNVSPIKQVEIDFNEGEVSEARVTTNLSIAAYISVSVVSTYAYYYDDGEDDGIYDDALEYLSLQNLQPGSVNGSIDDACIPFFYARSNTQITPKTETTLKSGTATIKQKAFTEDTYIDECGKEDASREDVQLYEDEDGTGGPLSLDQIPDEGVPAVIVVMNAYDDNVIYYPTNIELGFTGTITLPEAKGGKVEAIEAKVTKPTVGNPVGETAYEVTSPTKGLSAATQSGTVTWSGSTTNFENGTTYNGSITLSADTDWSFDTDKIKFDEVASGVTLKDEESAGGVYTITGITNTGSGVTITFTYTTPALVKEKITEINAVVAALAPMKGPNSAGYTTANVTGTGVVPNDSTELNWLDTEGNLTSAGNFKAGQTYTASFNVTADASHEFDTDGSAPTASVGDAGTALVSVTDASTATVTITYTAFDKKVTDVILSMSDGSGIPTEADFNLDAPYTAPEGLQATIQYNDGTDSGVITTAGFSTNNLRLVISAKNSGVTSTDVSAAPTQMKTSHNNNYIYVEYAPGTPTSTGNNIYKYVQKVTVTAKVDGSALTMATPMPGQSVTAKENINASVGSVFAVEWYDNENFDIDGENNTLTADTTFQYGKIYTAIITVRAPTDYMFSADATFTLNGESVPRDEEATEALQDVSVYKTFEMPEAPKVADGTYEYDYYKSGESGATHGSAVTIPFDFDVPDDTNTFEDILQKVEIEYNNGSTATQELKTSNNGNYIYSLSEDKKSIIVSQTALQAIAETSGVNLNEIAKSWTLKLTIAGKSASDPITATISAKDTTPYLTVTGASSVTVAPTTGSTGNLTAGTKGYPLVKGTNYTITYTGSISNQSIKWAASPSGDGVTFVGNDNSKTATITVADGTYAATVTITIESAAAKTITVDNTVTGGKVKDGDEDAKSSYTVYPAAQDAADKTFTVETDGAYLFMGIDPTYDGIVEVDTAAKTITVHVSKMTGDITIKPTFQQKDQPVLAPSTATHVKNDGKAITYYYQLGAYNKDAKPTKAEIIVPGGNNVDLGSYITAGTNDGKIGGDGDYKNYNGTITIPAATMDNLPSGTYTVQITCTDADGITATATAELVVKSAVSVEQNAIVMPESTHGKAFTAEGIQFAVKQDNDYYHFRYNGGKWEMAKTTSATAPGKDAGDWADTDADKTLGDLGVKLHIGATAAASDGVAASAFVSTYNGYTMRHTAKSGGSTGKDIVATANGTSNNGDKLFVIVGSDVKSANIVVNKKTIQPTLSTTSVTKVYDSSSTVVTETPITANGWVADGDLAPLAGDAVAIDQITGTYYSDAQHTTTVSDVKTEELGHYVQFTFTLKGENGNDDSANYDVAPVNGSGTITVRPIVISYINIGKIDSAFQATVGNTATYGTNGTAKQTTLTSTMTAEQLIVKNDKASNAYPLLTTEGVKVDLEYSYGDSPTASTNPVNLASITITSKNDNYTVDFEPEIDASKKQGMVNPAKYVDDSLTAKDEQTYYYSDKLADGDVEISVQFEGVAAPTEYKSITAAKNAGIKVQWKGETSNTDIEIKDGYADIPGDHGEKVILITAGEQTKELTITVNPLPVTVNITGSAEKIYNGDGKFSGDDLTKLVPGNVTLCTTGTGKVDETETRKSAVSDAGLGVTISGASTATTTDINANEGSSAYALAFVAGTDVVLANNDNGNFTLVSVTNAADGIIKKRPLTVTAIKVPSTPQFTAVTDKQSQVTQGQETSVTFTKGDKEGPVEGEKPAVSFKYTYSDVAAAKAGKKTQGAPNPEDQVSISALTLADVSAAPANKNYTLTNEDSEVATVTGEVIERTIRSIKINPQPASIEKSGDKVYNVYGDTLDLKDMAVTVTYSLGYEKYTAVVDEEGNLTWTKEAQGADTETGITTDRLPFKLTWSKAYTGEDDKAVKQDELLTVTDHAGQKIYATISGFSDATKEITVNPRPITKIDITEGVAAPQGISKVYDQKTTLTEANMTTVKGYTYTAVVDKIGKDEVTVTPVYEKITYGDKNYVDGGKPLVFGEWTISTGDDGVDPENYTTDGATITSVNGMINKRPITLTGIVGIDAINMNDATPWHNNATASTSATGTNGNLKAVFAPVPDVDDGTGRFANDNVTITFNYMYHSSATASNNAQIDIENLDMSSTATDQSKNYQVTYKVADGKKTDVNSGVVNPITVTELIIAAAPDQFKNGAQYGDQLALEGMIVEAKYTSTYSETYKFADGKWQWRKGKSNDSGEFKPLGDDQQLPFIVKMKGAEVDNGDYFTDITDEKGLPIVVEVEDSNPLISDTSDDDTLVVNPRQVTITVNANPTVKREYNGSDKYTEKDIAYTVTAVGTYTPGANGLDALPTSTDVNNSATVTYNSKNATRNDYVGDDKATYVEIEYSLSNPHFVPATTGNTTKILGTDTPNAEKGEISGTVEIEKRKITVGSISVLPIDQYASVTVTGQKAKSGSKVDGYGQATFNTLATKTGASAADVVEIVYDVTYDSNGSDGVLKTSATVDKASIKLTKETAPDKTQAGINDNYDLTTPENDVKDSNVDINSRQLTITVTAAPNMIDATSGTGIYGEYLDLTGLTVTVSYGDTTETYKVKEHDIDKTTGTSGDKTGAITWTMNDEEFNGTLPFTLAWSGDNGSITTNTYAQTLRVDLHKGIVATHTESKISSDTKAVKVSPRQITAVAAEAVGTLTKTYDGKTNVTTDETNYIKYTGTGVLEDDEENVTISAAANYTDAHVNWSDNKAGLKDITFGAPELTNDYNGNYVLASSVNSVSGTVQGTITQKKATVTGIYVEETFTSDPPQDSDKNKTVTDAMIGSRVSAPGDNTPATITVSGVLSADSPSLRFTYTVVYDDDDLKTGGNNVAITVKDKSYSSTSDDVKYTDYDFDWTTNAAEWKGNILTDKFTGIEITAPNKLGEYTHGDTLELTGLKVKVYSTSNTAGTEYAVTGSAGSYTWDNGGLPDGVSVYINTGSNRVDLTENSELNRNAHYLKMHGQPFRASASGVAQAATTGTNVLKVKQAVPTVTASRDDWDKYYDGTPDVTNVTYNVDVKTIDGTKDDVTVDTVTAQYEGADVKVTGEGNTPAEQTITFSDIALTGNDLGNYDTTGLSIENKRGTIKPITINVTAIKDSISVNQSTENATTGITTTTTNYDYTVTDPSGGSLGSLTKPTIQYTYKFEDTNLGSNKKVIISDIEYYSDPTDYNFVVTSEIDEMTGTVNPDDVGTIAVKEFKTDYVYGDPLDLESLVVTVNGTKDIRYDSDPNSEWAGYGLIVDTSAIELRSDGVLTYTKNANGTVKVYDRNKTQEIELTITTRQRVLKVTGTSSITKVYDGTTGITSTTTGDISFDVVAPGDGETQYDAVFTGDEITAVTGIEKTAYKYSSPNVPAENGGDVALTKIDTTSKGTLNGKNVAEYTWELPTITGEITPKAITVAPKLTIYADMNATATRNLTQDTEDVIGGVVPTGDSSWADEADADKYAFTYEVPVTADQQKTATTHTVETYTHNVSANDGYVYNYKFTWDDAEVTVLRKKTESIDIIWTPQASYTYGDTLKDDLEDLVVRIIYDAEKNEYEDIHYGSDEWKEWEKDADLKLVWVEKATEEVNPEGVLKTGTGADSKNGKHIKATMNGAGGTLESENKPEIKVNPAKLAVTVSGKIVKTYNQKTDVNLDTDIKEEVKINVVSGDVDGDVFDFEWTGLKFYDSNDNEDNNDDPKVIGKNVGEGKRVDFAGLKIVAKDGEGDDAVDVSDQYEFVTVPTTTGDIVPLEVKIKIDPVPPIIDTTPVDQGVVEAFAGTNYTIISGQIYSGDEVNFTVWVEYVPPFVIDSYPPVTPSVKGPNGEAKPTGADAGNYTFKFEPEDLFGHVKNPVTVKIEVLDWEKQFTHGDPLDLDGMRIKVTNSDNKVDTYVCSVDAEGNISWTASGDLVGDATFTMETLPLNISIVSTTNNSTPVTTGKETLRHDEHDGARIVVGDEDTSSDATGNSPIFGVSKALISEFAIVTDELNLNKPYDGSAEVTAEITGKAVKVENANNSIVDGDEVTIVATDAVYTDSRAGFSGKDADDDKSISIGGYTLTGDDADNYTLGDNPAANNADGLTGTISQLTLTVTITNVPSISRGGTAKFKLTEDTDYDVEGRLDNGEPESLEVWVEYTAPGTITEEGAADVSYSYELNEVDDNNFNVSIDDNDKKGTVTPDAPSGLKVTDWGKVAESYEHGDAVDMDGMKVTVYYGDVNDNPTEQEYVYRKEANDGKGGWTKDGKDVTPPFDVKWSNEKAVEEEETLRLDTATTQGFADTNEDDILEGEISVTIKGASASTSYENNTRDVSLTKKKLKLKVTGENISKPYDGTTTIGDIATRVTDGRISFTLEPSITENGEYVTLTDAAKKSLHYAMSDVHEDKALVFDSLALNNAYYEVSTAASDLKIEVLGTITQLKVVITAIDGSFSTAADVQPTNPLEAHPSWTTASYKYATGKGTGTDKFPDYKDDIIHITDDSGDRDDIAVTVPYTYDFDNADGNKVPVIFDNDTAAKMGTTSPATNYDIKFDIQNGEGTIIGDDGPKVDGIEVIPSGGYKHGDDVLQNNLKVIVNYDDGSRDEYEYENGSWTRSHYDDDAPETEPKVDHDVNLADDGVELTYTDGSGEAPKSVDNNTKIDRGDDEKAIDQKLEATVGETTGGSTFTVGKATLTVYVEGTATQVYQGQNHKTVDDLVVTNISYKAEDVVGDDEIGTVSGSEIGAEFEDKAEPIVKAPDVGTDKPIKITAGSFSCSGADAVNYDIKVESKAKGEITPKDITATADVTKIPSIGKSQLATNPKVKITDYTFDTVYPEDLDYVKANWEGVYDGDGMVDLNDSSAAHELIAGTSGNRSGNYNVTAWLPENKVQGEITNTSIDIITQPDFANENTDNEYQPGVDPIVDPLEGIEFTVTDEDGKEHHYKRRNHTWVDGTDPENEGTEKEDWIYENPEDAGITFTWTDDETNTPLDGSEDDILVSDDPEAKNTVTITTDDGTSKPTDPAKKKAIPEGKPEITINEQPDYTKPDPDVADDDPDNKYDDGDPIDDPLEGIEFTVTYPDGTEKHYKRKHHKWLGEEDGFDGDPEDSDITFTWNADDEGNGGEEIDPENPEVKAKDDKKNDVTIVVTDENGTKSEPKKTDGVETLKEFTVTIIQTENGTTSATADGKTTDTSMKVKSTKEVTITTKGNSNYVYDKITVKNLTTGEEVTVKSRKFIMPKGDVEITVTYKKTGGGGPAVGGGGTTNVKPTEPDPTTPDNPTTPDDPTTPDKPTATDAPGTNGGNGGSATPEPTEAPKVHDELFSKDMLNPYIIGYDDHVFGPELPISREEVATIFARLIANSIYMDKSYDASFPDVTEAEWSKDYIGYLEGYDVITGYPDGNFLPKNYITRAEMAVMMARAEGYDIEGYMSPDDLAFPDIAEGYGTWATKAIKYLTDAGVIEGYTDGTFRPERPITRAETVTVINRVLADMEVDTVEVLPSDMTNSHWAYDDVIFAMNHRILKGAAIDSTPFFKSDEFFENITTVTEMVEGIEGDAPEDTDAETENDEATDDTDSGEPADGADEGGESDTEDSTTVAFALPPTPNWSYSYKR